MSSEILLFSLAEDLFRRKHGLKEFLNLNLNLGDLIGQISAKQN